MVDLSKLDFEQDNVAHVGGPTKARPKLHAKPLRSRIVAAL
jgi:hypothetical protein